jgi:inosine/xanthosine triphosphatase
MIIHVGSKNEAKVDAVRDTLLDYPLFANAVLRSFEVHTGVGDQPLSLKETIQGAMNRAQFALEGARYSFGIESGIFPAEHTKSGWLDITVCAIDDGSQHHIGTSSAFEYPPFVIKHLLENKTEISDAFRELGLTNSLKLGRAEGAIGVLTKGRVTRKTLTQQAIMNALIHLENPELY